MSVIAPGRRAYIAGGFEQVDHVCTPLLLKAGGRLAGSSVTNINSEVSMRHPSLEVVTP